ncbi:MAG: asparagine synthase [Microbacterium sp.]|jgi:asparagine synthase (glutamine-hydrolysing)|nr:asparagine synthase [Microbacterium sp.]
MRFLLYPDREVVGPVPSAGLPKYVPHFSGRPWIVGSWDEDEIVQAANERFRVVLLGTVGAGDEDLRAWLQAGGEEPDFAAIHRAIAGAFFTLVTTSAGMTRAFGTLSSFRRLSYSTEPDAPIASNSLGLLVDMFRPALREERVPLALVAPRAPWPLGDASYWRGIENVLPTHELRAAATGPLHVRERWSLPRRHVPQSEVTAALTTALHDAVEARSRHARSRLSTDLSGGMDSTSLAFFAREHVNELTTLHLGISVEMNDDAEWADAAAQALGSRHIRVSHEEFPRWFAGWHVTDQRFAAEPEPSIRTEGMHRAMAERLSEQGCTIHLAGSGGDELFYPDEAVLPGLRREAPAALYEAIRGMATLHRWPLGKTVRAALNRDDPHSWLVRETASLGTKDFERPAPAWDVPFSLSPWATQTSLSAAQSLILENTADAHLDAAFASDAVAYGMITRNGQIHRALDEQTREVGVRYEAPFLDDAVVELALQVRLLDRLNTRRFKPGLAAAAAGVVPEPFLNRRSKGDYISLIYAAFNEHRRAIAAHADDFHLGRRGLVDVARLKTYLRSMQPQAQHFFPFEFLLATERWLRSADHMTLVNER